MLLFYSVHNLKAFKVTGSFSYPPPPLSPSFITKIRMILQLEFILYLLK